MAFSIRRPDNCALSEKPAGHLQNANTGYLARTVGKPKHMDATGSDVERKPLDFRENAQRRGAGGGSGVVAARDKALYARRHWENRTPVIRDSDEVPAANRSMNGLHLYATLLHYAREVSA
jgi:hypothetical protein